MTFLATLLLFALVISQSAAAQEHDEAGGKKKHAGLILAEAQVAWLRSKGGFYSDKISIRPLFESDSATAPLGLFANQPMTKGETLMQIPVECLLKTGVPDSDDMCDTALNLVRQRKLQEKSFHEPYVSYMYSKTRIQLPSSWSPEGRKLLLQIRGKLLPPEDLTQVSFANHCSDHEVTRQGYDPQELEFSYLTVVSRAWGEALVPVFDMINHHSGRYANVDSTSIHDKSLDRITAYATRDIPAGQQLFLSYMDCIDEKGYELEYVLPQLLRDFGYVDDYPQRWTFPTPVSNKKAKLAIQQASPDDNFVFEIDFVNEEIDALYKAAALQGPPEMKITWLTGEPSEQQLLLLTRELKRIETLQPQVILQANQLQDDYERKVALDYYNSLAMALHYATGNVTLQQESCDSNEAVCLSGLVHDEGIPNLPPLPNKDMSNQQPVTANNTGGDSPQDWMACEDYWKIEDDYTTLDEVQSWYQSSLFYYHEEDDDVCLYMDGYLHACASSRPHYHEVFVHYAARYLDQVQRVLFIGGGDSMVLHEVLKYPSLELVVGLELDHRVVRASFKNFGTQPHWDNDKVQWYFGDAAKSLLVLPSDYYGTFDLVIVDILTEVAESLEVNHELKVIEAAMLLLKPNGIIVKNEDQGYVPGSSADYTKYTLDLIYHDVPKYCLQVFVAGSNSLDFLTTTPKDHGVETLYLKGIDDFQAHFDSWYNYGGSPSARKTVCEEQQEEKTDEDDKIWSGVLMVLEAEKVAIPLESVQSVIPGISQALSKAGLSELESVSFRYSENGFSHTVLAQEGFVVARCKPELRYCGFDIQLYGAAIEKLEVLKTELVAAVQSNQSSSYRFVTLGMFGRPQEGKIGPPSATKLCPKDGDHDAPVPTRVRKERSAADFGDPQPSTMHDYSTTSPFAQWQSQRPHETQLLLMIEVAVFWVGERVQVNHTGELLSGTVVRVGDEMNYDIKYDGESGVEENVEEARIKRIEDPFDSSFVSTFLTTSLKFVLQAAGQNIDSGNSVQMEIPKKIGDGLVFVISWMGGTAVGTWDGFAGVSFNIILSSVGVNLGETIGEAFTDNILLLNFDVFPRGTGNVVNFKREIGRDEPVWA